MADDTAVGPQRFRPTASRSPSFASATPSASAWRALAKDYLPRPAAIARQHAGCRAAHNAKAAAVRKQQYLRLVEECEAPGTPATKARMRARLCIVLGVCAGTTYMLKSVEGRGHRRRPHRRHRSCQSPSPLAPPPPRLRRHRRPRCLHRLRRRDRRRASRWLPSPSYSPPDFVNVLRGGQRGEQHAPRVGYPHSPAGQH